MAFKIRLNAFLAGAPSRTPLGAHDAPQTPAREGTPLPKPHPNGSLWRLDLVGDSPQMFVPRAAPE